MRKFIRWGLLVVVLSLTPVAAQAKGGSGTEAAARETPVVIQDAHGAEDCFNWIVSNYRMGWCQSVHHATGVAKSHVRTHTYKKSGSAWVDMRADSQTVNEWNTQNELGFTIWHPSSSVGGQIVVTHHSPTGVSLNCPNNQPYQAISRVTKVSFRTDTGIPYTLTTSTYSPWSARPC